MKILFLAHRIPYPPNKGEKTRSFNMLKYLARRHELHLCCLADDPNDLKHKEKLKEYCSTVEVVYNNKTIAKLRSLFYLFSRQPLSFGYFHSRVLHRIVRKKIQEIRPDVIFTYSSTMAQYVPHETSSPVVLDMVDADSDKWLEYSKHFTWPLSSIYRLEYKRMRSFESKLVDRCSRTILSCRRELEVLPGTVDKNKIDIVFNGVDGEYFSQNALSTSPPSNKASIVFTGTMDYFANTSGVLYFVDTIFPLIQEKVPEAEFYVVGSNPTKRMLELRRRRNVHVTGFVEDTRCYLSPATVFIAPLVIARGIQNKLLEAMSMGCAVVTTSKALGDIEALDGEHLLVADRPDEFATQVLRLLSDSGLRKRLGQHARGLIERKYRWSDQLKALEDILIRSTQHITETTSKQANTSKTILMLLTNCFDPDPRVYQEARSLIEDGQDVTLICWDRDYKKCPYEELDRIKVERIFVASKHGRGTSQIPFLALFWLKAFYRAMKKDFDIVHCHDFDTLPLGYLIALLKRKKIVYDAHESYPDMLADNVSNSLKKVIRYVEDLLVRKVDLLITVGETLRKNFEQRGARNTCVVANCKNVAEFEFPEHRLLQEKRRLGIPPGKPVVSYMTWLSNERSVPSLLEAIKERNDVYLLIGGDGPLKEWVQEQALRSANIIYLGFVSPKDIPLYTALADSIFYGFDKHNSNAKYSAPNKLYEALAAGRAIITGDFGEIGKIVKEEKCGVLIRENGTNGIKEALADLLRAKDLEEYKNNAKRIGINKFNWKMTEKVLLSKYKSVSGI